MQNGNRNRNYGLGRLPVSVSVPPILQTAACWILLGLLLTAEGLFAQSAAQSSEPLHRRLSFSGMVDADFASDYGTFNKVSHASGLEADLSTVLRFSPTLNAVVRTTMRDGIVPQAGMGNTWAPLRFDGAQVNWQADEKTTLMVGDLVAGSGYFQYYRYKRTAALVGEHSVRGAGFRRGEILVHAGVANDTAGMPGDVAVFARWTHRMNENMTWTPSMRYTFGVPKAYPFELGVSFEGQFEDMLEIRTHVGMNYWGTDTDPGSLLLVEPRYTYEPYFFSALFFYSDKGEVPSPNTPRQTFTWNHLDDFILQVEPGMTLNKTFATGLSLELRNASMDQARDISVWMLPTLYAYPAPRAEWRSWAGLAKPLISGSAGNPQFSLGSEISFTF